MKTSTLAAVLGNVVSLIALWLVNFGIELTPQQQLQIVNALLLIVNTCALIIPAVVAGLSKRQGSADAQSGRALPGLLLTLGLVSLFAVSLGACSLQPQNSREALALGYTAHTALTQQVIAATTSHAITVDQAEQAREALSQSLDALNLARELLASDHSPDTALQRAVALLTVVEDIVLLGSPPQ